MGKRSILILVALISLFMIAGLYRWIGPYYVRVPSAAMEPTIRPGDRLFVNSIVGEVGRGDLVMFRFPTDPREIRISRVVAVGGDSVQLRGTQVVVNGEPLRERRIFVVYGDEGEVLREVGNEGEGDYSVYYEKDSRVRPEAEYASRGPYRVPAGHLFTLGDNRDNSEDSRYRGSVPVAAVIGRPQFVYATETEGEVSRTYRRLR
jgi:signal peptidase I